jgi:hypothetical protein
MYKRRTPGSKRDPAKQWALPDRVFFAAGACHILAYAFLESYPDCGFQPVWIRPIPGHTGNHIVLVRGDVVFDYHGYSDWKAYWTHTKRRATQFWGGWDADTVAVHREALVSNLEARRYSGLVMKEPKDYLFDPRPRARAYLLRFVAAGYGGAKAPALRFPTLALKRALPLGCLPPAPRARPCAHQTHQFREHAIRRRHDVLLVLLQPDPERHVEERERQFSKEPRRQIVARVGLVPGGECLRDRILEVGLA